MIDHLSFAVADTEKAAAFYDAALAPLGASRMVSFERAGTHVHGYGRDGKPSFWIAAAAGGAPQPMSGHLAFAAPSRSAVDGFYRAAMAGGATDNGAPGLRPHYHENYYAAFVIDPDGNRLEAVCHRAE